MRSRPRRALGAAPIWGSVTPPAYPSRWMMRKTWDRRDLAPQFSDDPTRFAIVDSTGELVVALPSRFVATRIQQREFPDAVVVVDQRSVKPRAKVKAE